VGQAWQIAAYHVAISRQPQSCMSERMLERFTLLQRSATPGHRWTATCHRADRVAQRRFTAIRKVQYSQPSSAMLFMRMDPPVDHGGHVPDNGGQNRRNAQHQARPATHVHLLPIHPKPPDGSGSVVRWR
jgi:hypothetical protein